MKREQKKNIENLQKEIEAKKKIPQNVKEKINAKRFENIAIVAIIIMYLAALNLGMGNIPKDMYIMDLKVFSIILLITTIIIFEYGYKKDDGGIWLHGIEVMGIAVFTSYLIHLYTMYYLTYGKLIISVAIIYLVYFIIKSFIVKKKIKKEYNKSLIDINEIVKTKKETI